MTNSGIPYFKAWLIFTLLSVLLSVFAGMAIGFVLGMAMGMAGLPIETVQIVCSLAGLALGLLVSFAMFRWVVDRFIVPAVTSAAGDPSGPQAYR